MALKKCSMCYMLVSDNDWIAHVARNHKFDPNFKINCIHPGCGASYKQWSSFQKHLKRVHDGLEQLEHDADEAGGGPIDHIVEEISNNNVEIGQIDDSNTPPATDTCQGLSGYELLKWHASMFVVNLKESSSIPQTTVDKVVDGVQELIDELKNVLKGMILDFAEKGAESVRTDFINQVFDKWNGASIFDNVRSAARVGSFLEKCGMVKPEKKELGKSRIWTKDGKLSHHKDCAYVVPFLKNIEYFLNNDDVLSCIDNQKQFDGTFRTVLDGSYYQSHKIFEKDRKSLSIIIYYDDVEFANPLGSKTHKLAMFYWTLGNIHPELRSSLRSINLLAIASHSNLKKYGAQSVLSDFLNGMAQLGSDEGVSLCIKGKQRKFTGILNFVAGDTPASAYLGGFKEGVGFSQRPCRTCLGDKETIRQTFAESSFVMRNHDTHVGHCNDLNADGLTKQARDFWSTFYGVNFRSAFMDMSNTDVTKIFPHDFMHVMFEGVLLIEIKNFLAFCINEGLFNLNDFNASLASFDFGHLQTDKPSRVEPQHLINGLKQGAAQMMCLGHFLPFLIGQWLTEEVRDHLRNYVNLLQIINLAMAYELEVKDAILLKIMVRQYLTKFIALYPDQTVTPKMHYLIHLGSQVLLFGPIRQQSCFRFEGAHAYYKQLISKLKNFKNVPFSLATRRQALMASQLACIPGAPSRKFLNLGHTVRNGTTIPIRDHVLSVTLSNLLQINDSALVMISPSVTIHGCEYRKGSVILLENLLDDLPRFAQVKDIVVHADTKLLVYDTFQTLYFEEKLNAYRIEPDHMMGVINVEELIFPHPLSRYVFQSYYFVILLNSNRIEFQG